MTAAHPIHQIARFGSQQQRPVQLLPSDPRGIPRDSLTGVDRRSHPGVLRGDAEAVREGSEFCFGGGTGRWLALGFDGSREGICHRDSPHGATSKTERREEPARRSHTRGRDFLTHWVGESRESIREGDWRCAPRFDASRRCASYHHFPAPSNDSANERTRNFQPCRTAAVCQGHHVWSRQSTFAHRMRAQE